MTNSGELNFNVSAINGDAYGLRGTETEESWNNEGTIFSDVIAMAVISKAFRRNCIRLPTMRVRFLL